VLLLTGGKHYLSWTVALAFVPLALESSAVDPEVDPESFFLVLVVSTHVLSTIWPLVDSFPVHHVILPLSSIATPVTLAVTASAFNLALEPVAFVERTVDPLIGPLTVFKATFELSFVCVAISGDLYPLT
jgi:hypothetical protein